jgi:hypothetical protein
MVLVVSKTGNPKQKNGQNTPEDTLGFAPFLPLANSGIYIVVIFQSLHQYPILLR